MTEFLNVTFAYPTVVFSGLLVLAFLYWLMVIIGALGIDLLDFDVGTSHGASEGGVEAMTGAMKGAVEGATGAVKGAVEGATGAVKGVAQAAEAGIVGSALVSLQLRNVPMTLVLSVWMLVSWLCSYFGAAFLLTRFGLGGSFLAGTGLALASVIVALPVTSLFVRPFARVLKVERQTLRADQVGKVVLVDTSRVDARFGSARAEDGGAGLIIQIRCDSENQLTRGSQAIVLSYDEARDAYEVAPVDDILPSRNAEKDT